MPGSAGSHIAASPAPCEEQIGCQQQRCGKCDQDEVSSRRYRQEDNQGEQGDQEKQRLVDVRALVVVQEDEEGGEVQDGDGSQDQEDMSLFAPGAIRC